MAPEPPSFSTPTIEQPNEEALPEGEREHQSHSFAADELMEVDGQPGSEFTKDAAAEDEDVSADSQISKELSDASTGDITKPELESDISGELEMERKTVEEMPEQVVEKTLERVSGELSSAVAAEESVPPSDVPMQDDEATVDDVPQDVTMGELDDDQQSDLTALSDSESTRLPARGAEAGPSQDPSLSSGELTELPTPEELEESSSEHQLSSVEDIPEPGPSKRVFGRKNTHGKGRGKGKKKAIVPAVDPGAGKIVLKRGQALLEGGTLGECFSPQCIAVILIYVPYPPSSLGQVQWVPEYRPSCGKGANLLSLQLDSHGGQVSSSTMRMRLSQKWC